MTHSGTTISELEKLVDRFYVSGGVDSDTRTANDRDVARTTVDVSPESSRCNSDPLTLDFVYCSHSDCIPEMVEFGLEHRCIVTDLPFCDTCIEFHRQECGICTLHLEQVRAENRKRLESIPEPTLHDRPLTERDAAMKELMDEAEQEYSDRHSDDCLGCETSGADQHEDWCPYKDCE